MGRAVKPDTLAAPAPPRPARPKPKMNPKMWWLTQFRNWHWISGAICLAGIFLFALTGITLNHAADIEAKPVVTRLETTLAPETLAQLGPGGADAPVPDPVAAAIDTAISIDVAGRPGEWSDDEVYVALPRPGGDAFLTIDRLEGAVQYERTDRGWVSYLNDLHKGRNTGTAWIWFIDIFAVACIVFSVTGICLLYMYARNRKSTWPLVGLGFAIPILLAIFFIH
ncbi:hypothetical protein sos41_04170 [Alphaproteobacteria bacterium SO-S41]|nr:hypothetical protein sos41_04170 [Alphaproteobacteria bacterium SO-S41]